MNILWVLGAGAGAVVGALVWAGITSMTNLEVGYVAWAIGGLVGLGSYLMGGRGSFAGLSCAVLALMSILLGKALALQVFVKANLRERCLAMCTRDHYQERVKAAAEFAELKSEDDYPRFMIQHEPTRAKVPAQVTAEELDSFKEFNVPVLERLHREKLDFEAWRELAVNTNVQSLMRQAPLLEALFKSLGPIDLLFGFLGIGTAYRIGSGQLKAKGKPAGTGSQGSA